MKNSSICILFATVATIAFYFTKYIMDLKIPKVKIDNRENHNWDK